uniref:TNFR-Cys domain-containing protein n=1 Tax=Biomphalaria glabrata TaxID=6526 RepID=A0A2C9M960_BIOGL
MFLLLYIFFLRNSIWTTALCPVHYFMTEVVKGTCESYQKGIWQIPCDSGKQKVNINHSDYCCVSCSPCGVCGLGVFLYHDFEGRACGWNSNVICCEEENMDVSNDHCVHRTTPSPDIILTSTLSLALEAKTTKKLMLRNRQEAEQFNLNTSNKYRESVFCFSVVIVINHFVCT